MTCSWKYSCLVAGFGLILAGLPGFSALTAGELRVSSIIESQFTTQADLEAELIAAESAWTEFEAYEAVHAESHAAAAEARSQQQRGPAASLRPAPLRPLAYPAGSPGAIFRSHLFGAVAASLSPPSAPADLLRGPYLARPRPASHRPIVYNSAVLRPTARLAYFSIRNGYND